MNKEFPALNRLEAELSRVKSRREFIKIIISTISSLIVVAAVAVLVSTLFMPVLRVTGTSMAPTLMNDQFVVCRKTGNFERGDIVAFYYNNKILLKRVIGVSGDYINIDDDGNVYVNDELLDEPYLSDKALGECDIELPYQVPDERIFVMGDRRSTSIDSRSSTVGCISEEAVLGKVVLRIWPFDDIGFID